MLVALADTHGVTTPRLTDHLRRVLDEAELIVHAGDLTTTRVHEAFDAFGGVRAVAGNSDDPALAEKLPETRTIEWGDRRFTVAHGHRRGWTGLSMLARQERSDVVVVGHTHRAWFEARSGVVVVNPGSHADPRGERGTYASFERSESGVVGQCRTVDGCALETVRL